MDRAKSRAERFISDLEGLLHAAREAAAAELLAEGSAAKAAFPFPSQEGAGPPALTLYACQTDRRDGRLHVVVQLLGEQALYEGEAASADWAEPGLRIAARAALAAIDEWMALHRVGDEKWGDAPVELGLGDALEVPTGRGPAAVVTIAVRPKPDLAAGRGDGADDGRDVRWLIGAAWSGEDKAAGAVRAVLNALHTFR